MAFKPEEIALAVTTFGGTEDEVTQEMIDKAFEIADAANAVRALAAPAPPTPTPPVPPADPPAPDANLGDPEPDEKLTTALAELETLKGDVTNLQQTIADGGVPTITGDSIQVLGERMDLNESHKSLKMEQTVPKCLFYTPQELAPGSARATEQEMYGQWQGLSDDAMWLTMAMRAQRSNLTWDVRESRWYKREIKRLGGFGEHVDKHFKLAMSTTGQSDWVPTITSSRFVELVRNELVVAPMFPTITMEGKVVDLPGESTDPVPYKKVSENSTMTASDVADQKFTLTAVALAIRSLWSDEVDEDSIVPMLGQIQKQQARMMAETIDFNIIHGDLDNVQNQSSNSQGKTGAYHLWDGIHSFAIDASNITDNAGARVSGEDIVGMKQRMGKYAHARRAVWITSFEVYDSMMLMYDTQSSGWRNIVWNPNGAEGTLLGTQAATLFGMSLVPSDQVMSNNGETGYYTATTVDRSQLYGVNTDSFILGTRRDITVETDKEISKGQLQSVITWRGDFQPLVGSSEDACEALVDIEWDAAIA